VHPLYRRRHRGRRITADATVEQLRLATALRDRLVEDLRSGGTAGGEYVDALSTYVSRYGEHWARMLDTSPFEFPEIPGGVGPGWQSVLDELDGRLQQIDPGYYVEQVKQKFGALRVYVISLRDPTLNEQLVDVAAEFETASTCVCEQCGGPGRLRQVAGEWQTVCAPHIRV
jgi:hypothetical protein